MSYIKEAFKDAAVITCICAAAGGVTVGAMELAVNGVIPVGAGALVWPASAVAGGIAIMLYANRPPRKPASRQKKPNVNQHQL